MFLKRWHYSRTSSLLTRSFVRKHLLHNEYREAAVSYARNVGRVGALAVALGVGVAIASNPGIASALPDTDSSPQQTHDNQSSHQSTDSAPGAASGSPSTPSSVRRDSP